MRSLLFLLLATVATTPTAAAQEPGAQAESRAAIEGQDVLVTLPGFEPEDPLGNPTEIVTRVLDEETGLPIAGAVVRVVREPTCAVTDRWNIVRTGVSDRDGWVRIPSAAQDRVTPWIFVLADGYAPRAEFTAVPVHPVSLRRGLDVPIEVRDWWDRPIAGVSVEQLLGCGHTPNVRRVVTDAAGRAVIPSVDPVRGGDLWPVKEGFRSDYGSIHGWRPGDPPVLLRMSPGPVWEGIVVGPDGKPTPNVFVGAPHCHRGPWSMTDVGGRFRVVGSSSDQLVVYADELATRPVAIYDTFAGDPEPIVIRLPPAGGEIETHETASSRPMGGGAPARMIRLRPRDLPEGARVRFVTADRETDVTDALDTPIEWEPDAPAAVRVLNGDAERILPIEAGTGDLDVPVEWYPPAPVLVRLFAPDGKPASGMVAVESARAESPDADPANARSVRVAAKALLGLRLAGPVFVYAWPDDRGLAPARAAADLPAPDGRVVEVDVRFTSADASRVVVRAPDGSAVSDRPVVLILGRVVAETRTQGDGVIQVPWLPIREGTTLLVEPDDAWVPVRARLQGAGPWSVRLPDTRIEVAARRPDGSTLESFVVFAASHPFEARDGSAVVRGLEPGRHELWVGARNHVPKRIEVVVAPGSTPAVAVTLRPKP